jgi:hypothetical protein
MSTSPSATVGADTLPYHKTFHYTGKEQSFKVPLGVKWITVIATGAAGGGVFPLFGRPGRVSAIIPVRQGERLIVYVGGVGDQSAGGFNGGAKGGAGIYHCIYCVGYGGGGASDIRRNGDNLHDRILVVGGGGGEGALDVSNNGAYGGDGGGSTGESGSMKSYGAGGGGGGSQHHGGVGGSAGCGFSRCGRHGSPGSRSEGGDGGNAAPGFYAGAGGGGGGGGYYGGGGGGGDGGGASHGYYAAVGGGGGGGSSYIEPSAMDVYSWQGWYKAYDGVVVFSW